MTVVQIKRLLRILNGQYDSYIAEILPLIIAFVETECNREFPQAEDGTPIFPKELELFVAKAVEHNLGNAALKGESFAEQKTEFNTDYPTSIMRILHRHRVVRFV